MNLYRVYYHPDGWTPDLVCAETETAARQLVHAELTGDHEDAASLIGDLEDLGSIDKPRVIYSP